MHIKPEEVRYISMKVRKMHSVNRPKKSLVYITREIYFYFYFYFYFFFYTYLALINIIFFSLNTVALY